MRALFTTQPGFGHLNPLLPYAFGLREAGHEVRFASAPSFAEAIERHGFACVGIGEDFTWERAAGFFPGLREAALAGRATEYAVFDISWGRWNPAAARDLLALFERWRPDVIVREFAENGAALAGDAAGVPVVCAAWGASPTDRESWGEIYDWDRVLRCYAQVRRDLGMGADVPGGAWERETVFNPLPPSWLRAGREGTGVRHFRLPAGEGASAAPPPWLEAMGRDRMLVYATLGTVHNKLRRLRAAFLEALAELDADVLMTVGRDVDPGQIGIVPPNVRVEPFVAQSGVLSRASLVVSHAGFGTMLGAIYHGVPLLVVAIGGDQPVHARRAEELGIAVALEARDADAPRLRDSARRVLADGGLHERARALRDECDAMAPVTEAVAVLEELVRATG